MKNSVLESVEALRVRFPLYTRVIWKDDEQSGDGMGDWPAIVVGHGMGLVLVEVTATGQQHHALPQHLEVVQEPGPGRG